MLRALILFATLQATLAQAVCLNPLGCAPTNYQECLQQAADTSKTESAAKALIASCDRFKFTEAICTQDARAWREDRARPNSQVAALRKLNPELNGLDDNSVVDVIQQVYYPDLPRETVATKLGLRPAPDRTDCRRLYPSLYR